MARHVSRCPFCHADFFYGGSSYYFLVHVVYCGREFGLVDMVQWPQRKTYLCLARLLPLGSDARLYALANSNPQWPKSSYPWVALAERRGVGDAR